MRSRDSSVRIAAVAVLLIPLALSAAGCAAQRAEVRMAFALGHSSDQRKLLAVNRKDFPDPKNPRRAKPTTTGSTFVRDLAFGSKVARKTLETRGVPDFFKWDREGAVSFVFDLYYPNENVVVRIHNRMSGDVEEEFPVPEGDMRLIEKRQGKAPSGSAEDIARTVKGAAKRGAAETTEGEGAPTPPETGSGAGKAIRKEAPR